MYSVVVGPHRPFVIDKNRQQVSDAHVMAVHFPSQPLQTSKGTVREISGPPTADIMVKLGDVWQPYFGVPVV